MRRRSEISTVGLLIGLAWVLSGCGGGAAGTAVNAYVGHLRAGQHEAAYAMVTTDKRARLPIEQWKQAMHTEVLADVQGVSVRGKRTLTPGGTCLYTSLDFATRNDEGPYGYYIFYLREDGGALRIEEVLTYDRIEGDTVKTTHFDESLEPFPCKRGGY